MQHFAFNAFVSLASSAHARDFSPGSPGVKRNMVDPFRTHADAALALINAGMPLKPREGQFLGGLTFDAASLSEKQRNWLVILLAKHGLPLLADGGAA